MAAPLAPMDSVIKATDSIVEQPAYTSNTKNNPGTICENRQKNFLILVVLIKFLAKIQSPITPKMADKNSLARYGRADMTPAAASWNPNTLDTNFGPTVIIKYKPHKFP